MSSARPENEKAGRRRSSFLSAGNTNATAIMIGERASDLILSDLRARRAA